MTPLILIADDHEAHRTLVNDTLQAAGYRTLTASDGAHAIELARSAKPNLILMDVQMPVLDGVSAVKALKADSRTAAIPTVAITARCMAGDRERLLGHGFDGYLSKPVSLRDLRAIVASYVGALL